MRWARLGVPARQVPLGARLRPAAVPVRQDSPEHPDSQLEREPRAEVRPEMFAAVRDGREIARAKSMQARMSIGRY